LAKRVNHGFAKRQKEIKRQQKKEQKEAKKALRREAAAGETDPAKPGTEGG
jgi:hypothetical protein